MSSHINCITRRHSASSVSMDERLPVLANFSVCFVARIIWQPTRSASQTLIVVVSIQLALKNSFPYTRTTTNSYIHKVYISVNFSVYEISTLYAYVSVFCYIYCIMIKDQPGNRTEYHRLDKGTRVQDLRREDDDHPDRPYKALRTRFQRIQAHQAAPRRNPAIRRVQRI